MQDTFTSLTLNKIGLIHGLNKYIRTNMNLTYQHNGKHL